MPLRIAIVGVGKIARDQHVPALAASPDWTLAATASRAGSVEGIPSYTALPELLAAHPEIEAISLCLPPAPRFEAAMQAIRARRHVMLEKPPGASLAECHALEAAAAEAGVSIYATWHSREAAQVAAAKAWLADKTLKSLRIIWKEDVRRWHPGQEWIWRPGGLGVFDPGINAFSILTGILPVPVHVTGGTLDFPENCQTPIAAEIDFFHPGGASVCASLDFLKTGEQIWSMEIETEEGSLLLADGGARLAVDGVEQAAPGAGVDDVDDGTNPLLGGEYSRLYAKMAALVRAGESEMDLSPMVHVADAFLLGARRTVAPFHE